MAARAARRFPFSTPTWWTHWFGRRSRRTRWWPATRPTCVSGSPPAAPRALRSGPDGRADRRVRRTPPDPDGGRMYRRLMTLAEAPKVLGWVSLWSLKAGWQLVSPRRHGACRSARRNRPATSIDGRPYPSLRRPAPVRARPDKTPTCEFRISLVRQVSCISQFFMISGRLRSTQGDLVSSSCDA